MKELQLQLLKRFKDFLKSEMFKNNYDIELEAQLLKQEGYYDDYDDDRCHINHLSDNQKEQIAKETVKEQFLNNLDFNLIFEY